MPRCPSLTLCPPQGTITTATSQSRTPIAAPRRPRSKMSTLVAPADDATTFSSRFAEEGVLVVDPLVDSATVERLKQQTARIAEGTAPFPLEFLELEPDVDRLELATLRKINRCHYHDHVFAAHAAHPGILDVIEEVAILTTYKPNLQALAQIRMKQRGQRTERPAIRRVACDQLHRFEDVLLLLRRKREGVILDREG